MSSILVKIFATALALSQITTRPEAVKTAFDPDGDRQEVAGLLHAGCRHMIKTFDVEEINFDELLSTVMEDPQALTTEIKALHGLNFKDLHDAYREYCKKEPVEHSPVRLGEVIAYYNGAVGDLPDHSRLKGAKLPESSEILDRSGRRFTEVYEDDNRRIWVPLAEIPDHVRKAFVAAEDRRFFTHRGIDERGIVRAFMSNFAQSGRPQGGSTITQQIAKNLLVGDDLTYERKIKEMIVAFRLERVLSKEEILEIYLNLVFLGRASWGIEMAARSYFGKSAKALTLAEGALLAALTKGPNYYNPDRRPERARERLSYVLDRMREEGFITADEMRHAQSRMPDLVAFESPRSRGGFYFVDQVVRDAKSVAGVSQLSRGSYVVKSTIHPALQKATEAALQEGLARYELNAGRMRFEGPERNLAAAIRQIEAAEAQDRSAPSWRRALEGASLPLYDVHWTPAVVVEKQRARNRALSLRVGLADGRIMPLKTWSAAIADRLQIHDVVFVRVAEGGKRPTAELRVRPAVQGAALVLENRTGRILAMAGGFSYPLSQLNRATQAERQPGSALKPLTYLAALGSGLQPNTLVFDEPITLPPVGGYGGGAKAWTPKNYDGRAGGLTTIRQALEHSKNIVTARLLDGGIALDPESSLDRLCAIAREMELYRDCVRHYPFILGAQPVRLVDLAAFYAAIANEGSRPKPHVIEAIERDGRTLYRHAEAGTVPVTMVDRVAFYQLKTFLQGVLQRGTARQIRHLSPYVGGKTGTTDGENDAWFVGFTNDVTIAVWVGYDNADKRRTLGGGFTGGKVAVPIFETIVQAAWREHAPKAPLSPPSPEAKPYLIALPIDLRSGDRLYVPPGAKGSFSEHFRLSGVDRHLDDTRYSLVPGSDNYAFAQDPDEYPSGEERAWDFGGGDPYRRDDPYGRSDPYAGGPWWAPAPPESGRYVEPPMTDYSDRYLRRPRQIDPEYFWGRIY